MILPTATETAASIYGAWRLLRLDRAGMRFFDPSAEGFWKSFAAALIVAPGYLILVLIHLSEGKFEAGFLRILTVQSIAYVISWTAFPLVMHRVAEGIGRRQRYIPYIVAFNWSKVIQMMLYLPVSLLAVAGLLPDGLASLLTVLVSLAILGYIGFVTSTALEIGPFPAIALVLLDLVIGILVTVASDRLLA